MIEKFLNFILFWFKKIKLFIVKNIINKSFQLIEELKDENKNIFKILSENIINIINIIIILIFLDFKVNNLNFPNQE